MRVEIFIGKLETAEMIESSINDWMKDEKIKPEFIEQSVVEFTQDAMISVWYKTSIRRKLSLCLKKLLALMRLSGKE